MQHQAGVRSSRALRLAVAALSVWLLLPVGTARGHGTASTLTPVIDEVVPAVDGLRVSVQASQDATLLAVEVTEELVVEVLDDRGEPWARVGSDEVEVDLSSPAMHAATNANGAVPDPLPDRDDPWVRVGDEGRFQWFAHSLHPADLAVPDDVLRSERAVDVADWEVPLRADGADVVVRGRLRHVPVTGSVVPRLRSAAEIAPGVTVEVAAGAVPALFLRNQGDDPVVVLSRDGQPYAIVDETGVQVNTSSATWLEQRRVAGDLVEVPDEAVVERVSTTPSHTWLETRAALPGVLPDEDVRAAGREVVVRTWEVPVQVGERLLLVEGETVWVPLAARDDGVFTSPWAVAAVVVGVLLAVAGWRRRGAA